MTDLETSFSTSSTSFASFYTNHDVVSNQVGIFRNVGMIIMSEGD